MPIISPHKLFRYTLLITVAYRLAVAAGLPIIGDEAYFVLWGRNLDYGYYDHPPMAGWWLHLMLYAGDSELVIRLPAVLVPALVGLLLYRLLRDHDPDRAALVATLWLLLPMNVVNVLITTDTPLILFAFLSGCCVYIGEQRNRLGWHALAGACLGLAFLSKYFAVLVGLAYVVYFLTRPGPGSAARLGILVAAALPFALINLWWNYNHCWDNILFNVFNRNASASLSLTTPLAYLATIAYVLTPPVAYYLARHWSALVQSALQVRLFLVIGLLPLALLAILSLVRLIGLHWVLAFVPFAMILVFASFSSREIDRALKFVVGFAVLHAVALAVVVLLPLHAWEGNRHYRSIVFGTRTAAIIDRLKPFEAEFHLATDSYTRSAVLAFYYDRPVSVFGPGSFHARQDDLLTDFRKLDGQNIFIFAKSAERQQRFAAFFDHAELHEWRQDGATFPVVVGYNFDYQKYKNEILRRVREQYYQIPDFLPTGDCYFIDGYFQSPPNAER